MLINNPQILETLFPIHTIIHVGAHVGQEVVFYRSLSPNQIVLIEADPIIFQFLLKNSGVVDSVIPTYYLNNLIGEQDGKLEKFFRFNNNGESSSIFQSTNLLRDSYPGIHESGSVITLFSVRLDSLLRQIDLSPGDSSILIIDTQGSELSVLRSCGTTLRRFRYIEVEVSTESLYQDSPLFSEVHSFLAANGYRRITEVPKHGDVLYERVEQPVILTLSVEQHKSIIESVTIRHHLINQNRALRNFMSLGGWSASQYGQDLFVLSMLKFKTNGFFVEFGATDGVGLSNTFLLEKEFGWNGILVEPATQWHENLRSHRNSIIDFRCVWKESGKKLLFTETSIGELSTITEYKDKDMHHDKRGNALNYEVESVTLLDLLTEHNAPRIVDYLSVDTEGSELDIIASFDFSQFTFRVITVEHNWTSNRPQICDILASNGYRRVFEAISECDDWYVYSGET